MRQQYTFRIKIPTLKEGVKQKILSTSPELHRWSCVDETEKNCLPSLPSLKSSLTGMFSLK